MTTPDTLNNGKPFTYGFGLGAGMLGTHRQISHNGGINGFTTASVYYPDDRANVVVFSNADAGPTCCVQRVARGVRHPVVAAPKPVVAVPLPDSIREKLLGTYDLAPSGGGKFVVHIMVENGQVMTQAEGPGQGVPADDAGNWVSARRSIRRCASRSFARTARSRRCVSNRAAETWRGRGGRNTARWTRPPARRQRFPSRADRLLVARAIDNQVY